MVRTGAYITPCFSNDRHTRVLSALPAHTPHTQLSLDVVELDPEVLSVAEKWFGFRQSERVRVHVSDGVQFVEDAADKKSEHMYTY